MKKYCILIEKFYYNQINESYIKHDCGMRYTWDTKEKAQTFLQRQGIKKVENTNFYTYEGTYYLQHNEYARPQYEIRKCK